MFLLSSPRSQRPNQRLEFLRVAGATTAQHPSGRVNGIQLAGAGSWKGRKSDQVKRETLSPAELTVCERASEKESAGAFDICICLQRERERGGERT